MLDNQIQRASCQVDCGEQQGTGCLISAGIVLTALHCVLPAQDSGSTILLTFQSADGDLATEAKILDTSEELDACLLYVDSRPAVLPLPIDTKMPRGGATWTTFGYPAGKRAIGHRLTGVVSHILPVPKSKIDIDLAVESACKLTSYKGLSGAPVVTDGACRGLVRLKVDGTVAAISTQRLEAFLRRNKIDTGRRAATADAHAESHLHLVHRGEFQKYFESQLLSAPGRYLFLEGAHGIGKTTFCNNFAPSRESLLYFGTYCVRPPHGEASVSYRAHPDVFVDWLSTTLASLLFKEASRVENQTYPAQVQFVSAILTQLSQHCAAAKQQGVIFIDGINEAITTDSHLITSMIGLLPQSLPPNVHVVFSAPSFAQLSAYLNGRVLARDLYSLPRLEDEACEEYCYKELADWRAEPAFVHMLCSRAKGHPLYLRYLIEHANANPGDELLEDFPELESTIETYYERIWSQLVADEHAVHLLAVIARLRPGLTRQELVKALDRPEQAVFVSTIYRIQHLLLQPGSCAVYHPSFSAFLCSKTSDLDSSVHQRLAEFCISEPNINYCINNCLFHLHRAGEELRRRSIVQCGQTWVDRCVEKGCEPDVLIADIEATLLAAVELRDPVAVIRILLLLHRVRFRYNSLFAQSARLISEALIALGRPKEALRHVIRFNTLIISPAEALEVAFLLISSGQSDEAAEVLELLRKQCEEGYGLEKLTIYQFVEISKVHIQSLLFRMMADGKDRIPEIKYLIRNATRNLEVSLKERDDVRRECITQIAATLPAQGVCFLDRYNDYERLKSAGVTIPNDFLQVLLETLVRFQTWVGTFGLNSERQSIPRVLADIERLLASGGSIGDTEKFVVIDSLIALGGSVDLVTLAAKNFSIGELLFPTLRSSNGVDVDFKSAQRCSMWWRTAAFLDRDLVCPAIGDLGGSEWLSSLERLICALSHCEGRARRARGEHNKELYNEACAVIEKQIFPSLRFKLSERVNWPRSYGIPEAVIPFVYHHLSRVLIECFDEYLPAFLDMLITHGADQLGLYTEGYRESIYVAVGNLQKSALKPDVSRKIHDLIRQWRDHVLVGVENRHELVPELLRLIIALARAEATEEAEDLFQRTLAVSMGPTWYKEDQLGLMNRALGTVPTVSEAAARLPLIAGYLERASGEMTFQRYIRYEKETFIGRLFERNSFEHGVWYYKRQTCGETTDLLREWENSKIDTLNVRSGYRYPGGAIDEQNAIHEIVRHALSSDWRLRWALLEIFSVGDERHIETYAAEYAKIVNEEVANASALSEIRRRVDVLVRCEMAPRYKDRFYAEFVKHLSAAASQKLGIINRQQGEVQSERQSQKRHQEQAVTASVKSSKPDENGGEESGFFLPGTFGTQQSMTEAETVFEGAIAQYERGNKRAARQQLIRMLEVLQEGGWSIWSSPSASARRAKDLLKELSTNAAEFMAAYTGLLQRESYIPEAVQADSLIGLVGDELNERDKILLLDCVIEHIALIVGDAEAEQEYFRVLGTPCSHRDSSSELFSLILWLLDHPKWLRRERAAVALAWLLKESGDYRRIAIRCAVAGSEGYAGDVICGILDDLSKGSPVEIWDEVVRAADREKFVESCKHLSRVAVFRRIAARAKASGSISGAELMTVIEASLCSGVSRSTPCEVGKCLEPWLECVGPELHVLTKAGIVTQECMSELEEILRQACSPLSIVDAYELEKAVSLSFREPQDRALDRWEGKVRSCLNRALLPYVPIEKLEYVESCLRIFNPSLPDSTLDPEVNSAAETILTSLSRDSGFSAAVERSGAYYLHYNEIAELGSTVKVVHIEITAVVVSSSLKKRGFFVPPINATFRSTELPASNVDAEEHETCYSLRPTISFLGAFTPSVPLVAFAQLIGAKDEDFLRCSWRNGRSLDDDHFGRPRREGCCLSIRKEALRLPEGKKLAWIIRINGTNATMIDADGNKLY